MPHFQARVVVAVLAGGGAAEGSFRAPRARWPDESIIDCIHIWDEVTVSEGYFEGALERSGIEITPAIRKAIDRNIPDSYKKTYRPQ